VSWLPDDAAATTHNEAAVSLLAQLATCATMLDAEIHGTAGPSIQAWATRPTGDHLPDLSAHSE
jgi:hypothetical protein